MPRAKIVGQTLDLPIDLYPNSAGTGSCGFNGPAKYVTTNGDIVLFKGPPIVHITMVIRAPGYTFALGNPIIIAENLTHKGQLGFMPNNFSNFSPPLTPPAAQPFTQLDFFDANNGNKHFYYSLNFIGPNGPFSVDPIILNN